MVCIFGGGEIISKDNDSEKLTKEEELLLLLLEHNYEKDNHVVSESITEQGISVELNCTIGYTSCLLKKNEENGYIYRTKLKIINGTRNRYVFFLTDTGLELAREIKNIIVKRKLNNNKFK